MIPDGSGSAGAGARRREGYSLRRRDAHGVENPLDDVFLFQADLDRVADIQGRGGGRQIYDARARAGHVPHQDLCYRLGVLGHEARHVMLLIDRIP